MTSPGKTTRVEFGYRGVMIRGEVHHGRVTSGYGRHPAEAILDEVLVEATPGVEMPVPFEDWLASLPEDTRRAVRAEVEDEAIFQAVQVQDCRRETGACWEPANEHHAHGEDEMQALIAEGVGL